MAKSRSSGGLILLLVVVVAAVAGGWYYWSKKTEKKPEFSTITVARGNIVQSVTATGDLQPVTSVDVSSQISGLIVEVNVDFNTPVKAGDVLARIDPATYESRLRQAEAQLANTTASYNLIRLNVERVRSLREQNLVSQQELDQSEAQFAQAQAQLQIQRAAVETARVDLSRCTIYAPIDGIVLSRATEKGKTVSASTSAPTLFVLVNNLTRMQINAAVAEADIGSIEEGQDVTFTVDAFPGRTFEGRVTQVRNAARANQSVVSYETLIDVNNQDLKLKPGMTANVSIVIARKSGVLTIANSALRVRIPQDLILKAPEPAPNAGPAAGTPAPVAMTDEERRRAQMEIMREAGWTMGAPPSPEVIEKAQTLAKAKGIEIDFARLAAARGQGGRGGGGGRMGGRGGVDRDPTMATVISRTLYKLNESNPANKKAEPVVVKLGISDGFHTEVLEGLAEGDAVVNAVTLPGAGPVLTQAPGGGVNNPFQAQRGGFGGGGGGRR